MIGHPSCKPCKAMKPRFQKAAEMLSGKVKFGSINILEQYKFSSKFEVKAVPIVKLWNTDAEISGMELKAMRQSVAGITKVAEKCMQANEITSVQEI